MPDTRENLVNTLAGIFGRLFGSNTVQSASAPSDDLDKYITTDFIKGAFPSCKNPDEWVQPFKTAFRRFNILTPHQIAVFCGIAGKETGDLTVLSENTYYSDPARITRIFSRKFQNYDLLPIGQQEAARIKDGTSYVKNPEKLANYVYSWEGGNGSPESGDGYRFRGGGCFQLTYRNAYTRAAADLGMDIESFAAWVRTPAGAAMSAAWYWNSTGMGPLAAAKNFTGCVLRVAGYTTMTPALSSKINFPERKMRYERACRLLGVDPN